MEKVNVDLNGLNIAYPAKLKRVYVVNVEEGQDERAMTGTVAFDNIAFTMPSKSSEVGLPTGVASLVLGQKSMTVNGTKKAIDAAPVLKMEQRMYRSNTCWMPLADRRAGTVKSTDYYHSWQQADRSGGRSEGICSEWQRQSATVAPYVSGGRTLVLLDSYPSNLG